MKDIRVEHLKKTVRIKTILSDVSFTISQGEHIGLIGQNGTGKSSLLNIIAGLDTAESGIIETAKDFRIAYLPQEPVLPEDLSIFDALYRSNHPLLKVVHEYEAALKRLNEHPTDGQAQKQFEIAERNMNQQNGWQMEVTIQTILKKVGIGDTTQLIKELSGGMKKRVGLAKALIEEPDLLLLDEPTNHLDVDAIRWLEEYLAKYKGSLMVVTHDRYFLENVVDHIFDLVNGKIETYAGNYQTYVEERAHREAIQQKMIHKQQRLYTQELEWMRQGAKARTTKQQARIQRFEVLEKEVKNQTTEQTLSIGLDQQRIGKRVFHLENISLAIGEQQIIDRLTLIVQANDRIGIVGGNGVGKSTFLNALAGLTSFNQGTFTVGQTVQIAYYKQMDDDIPKDKQLIQYLREFAEEVKQKNGEVASITTLLETFLFPKAMHGAKIGTLSGGERRRLYLLKLLITKPNVLLLDEPTNDLDIDTLTVLENYINEFNGAVIIVSHDRYFLDKTVTQLLELKGFGEIQQYLGTMSDYLDLKNRQSTQTTTKNVVESEPSATTQKIKSITQQRLSYHEKKEWDGLEDAIANLEEQMELIQTEMLQNSNDAMSLQELQQKLEQVEQQLEQAMIRWEELAPRTEL